MDFEAGKKTQTSNSAEQRNTINSGGGRRRVILIVGLGLFALGIVLTIYNLRKSPSAPSTQKQEDFLRQLSLAEPRFEIGYGPLGLDLFQSIQTKGQSGENELITYPVFQNEISERVRTNVPSITPDLATLKVVDVALREFAAAAKRNKMRLHEVSVICLIVKQVGRGKASSVMLDVDRINLAGAVEIYDATDITGEEDFGGNKLRRPDSPEQRQSFSLGDMDTGDAVLVPLYITNLFESLDENIESRQITNGITFIPLTIRYKDVNQIEQRISVGSVLGGPIYFEK